MTDRYEIRIAGVGGQGAMLAGIVLAEAVVFFENKFAVQSPSYTSQVRGGPTKADVIISDQDIEFPRTDKINFFLAMDQLTYDRFKSDMSDDGIILVDSNLVPNVEDERHNLYKLPINQIAKNELGKVVVANVVALGAIVALTKVVSYESMEKAVLQRVPKAFLDLNKKALEVGFTRTQEILKN